MSKSIYQQHIISKIRKLRQENGYSQQKIGTLLGVSNGQVGNIESLTRPHKYTLKQIKTLCHHFNIRIEQLFLDDEDYQNADIIELLINKIIEYGE